MFLTSSNFEKSTI